MFKLFGFPTQNSLKAVYVLEELGIDYEYQFVDLGKAQNMTDEFRSMTPIGKVPVLRHNDHHIFESGAIVRYLANIKNSNLYPTEAVQRSRVDAWLDFGTCHIGRWLNCLFFENIIKPKMGMGEPDVRDCEEARRFSESQFVLMSEHLQDNPYFAGNKISIADLTLFAYMEQIEALNIPIDKYTHLLNWYNKMCQRDSIKRGKEKIA